MRLRNLVESSSDQEMTLVSEKQWVQKLSIFTPKRNTQGFRRKKEYQLIPLPTRVIANCSEGKEVGVYGSRDWTQDNPRWI